MQDQRVQQIVNDLVKNYQPEKVILFGSRISGEVHKWSDVDLVAIKRTNKNFYDRIGEASVAFDHILPVDVIVYTPEEFEQMSKDNRFVREEVIKKGKVVYEQSQ